MTVKALAWAWHLSGTHETGGRRRRSAPDRQAASSFGCIRREGSYLMRRRIRGGHSWRECIRKERSWPAPSSLLGVSAHEGTRRLRASTTLLLGFALVSTIGCVGPFTARSPWSVAMNDDVAARDRLIGQARVSGTRSVGATTDSAVSDSAAACVQDTKRVARAIPARAAAAQRALLSVAENRLHERRERQLAVTPLHP